MAKKAFQMFVEGFLRDRGLPVSETLPQLQSREAYGTAMRQRRAGASDRVVAMLLERALRG